MLLPLLVGAAIALAPAPPGLPQYAWYYFAIFAAVITGLVVEPIPAAAVGLCGVAVAAALARYVLFAPAQVAKPGLQPDRRGGELGAVRLRQLHRLADLRRLHLLPGLREDRPGPAHLAAAGGLAGRPHAVARLRGGPVRHGAGAVHPIQHRAQRRHGVPGDQEDAGDLSTRCRTIRRRGGSAAT